MISVLLQIRKSQIRNDLLRVSPTGNEAGRSDAVREMGARDANRLNVLVEVDLLFGLDQSDVVVNRVSVKRFVLEDGIDLDDLNLDAGFVIK